MSSFNTTPKLGWSSAKFITSFSVFELTDIVAVSWSNKRAKKLLYGTGSQPIGFGVGMSEYEASMTLYLEQVLAIASAVPGGDLTSILPFDFTMTFTAEGSALVQTLTLFNCMFTESKVSIKQGDMSVEQELPMLYSGYEFI